MRTNKQAFLLQASIYTTALLCGLPVLAQTSDDQIVSVYSSTTVAQISQILLSRGYTSTESSDDEGNRSLMFDEGGKHYGISFADCVDDQCSTLEIYLSLTADPGLTLEELNDWNRSNYLVFTYMDPQKNTYIFSDLSFSGGITEQAVHEWMSVFFAKIDNFLEKFNLEISSGK